MYDTDCVMNNNQIKKCYYQILPNIVFFSQDYSKKKKSYIGYSSH